MSNPVDLVIPPERIQIHSGEGYVSYLVEPAGWRIPVTKYLEALAGALAFVLFAGLFFVPLFGQESLFERPMRMGDIVWLVLVVVVLQQVASRSWIVIRQAQISRATLTIDAESLTVRTKNWNGETSLHWRRQELRRVFSRYRTHLEGEHPLSAVSRYHEPAIWVETYARERMPILAGHFLSNDQVHWLVNALARDLDIP